MAHIAVVLAAGKGTRMRSALPKVLHEVAGRPMLAWVLDAVAVTGPQRTIVVVGHGGDQVMASLPPGVEACVQEPQGGTGHAVEVALAHVGDGDEDVVVVPGDVPLLREDTLAALAQGGEAAATILTAVLGDPTGYGRVVRGEDGQVKAVVEQTDADAETLAIAEVNVGMYRFRRADLAEALAGIGVDNAQGEKYLTDVVGWLVAHDRPVEAVEADPVETMGVNDHVGLARAGRVRRRWILERWMGDGVAVDDPETTYVDAGVTLAPGVRLHPGVHLKGDTRVEAGAEIGPDSYLEDTVVESGARIWYSVVRGARVGPDVQVGPYASLRPGTVLARGAKAGTFVEMKNTTVAEGAKVPHLSYLGDAAVGERANVGAGTITCNYDGYDKYRTEIGADAFIGSDTMLVAPVTIGEAAVTGAGSVITRDVAPGALAVERSPQREIPGYAARRAARKATHEAED